MATYQNQPPVFYTPAELRRAKKNNLANARRVIAAAAPPGDRRDNEEILNDVLAELRFWAASKRISFRKALTRSEHDYLIETGKIAENSIPPD
jgi:hypothetical protein